MQLRISKLVVIAFSMKIPILVYNKYPFAFRSKNEGHH